MLLYCCIKFLNAFICEKCSSTLLFKWLESILLYACTIINLTNFLWMDIYFLLLLTFFCVNYPLTSCYYALS